MFKTRYVFRLFYFISFCFFFFGLISVNHKIIFISLLSLCFYFIVDFFKKFFNFQIALLLELIIKLFIFASLILGELLDFYSFIHYWDNILHYVAGFISGCIGFSILLLFVNFYSNLRYLFFIFSICFSMTVGIFWEFFEFSIDRCLDYDMQKDSYVSDINSVLLNDFNSNVVSVSDIIYTDIYTDTSVIRINNGYLDIGLYDTILDLVMNVFGALTLFFLIHIKFDLIDKFVFLVKK